MGLGRVLVFFGLVLLAAVLFFRMVLPAQPGEVIGATPATGAWRAVLELPGGELPFGLEIGPPQDEDDGSRDGVIVNGSERIPVPITLWEDGRMVLDLRHYDAQVLARVEHGGRRLTGEWMKRRGEESWERLPFAAEAGAAPRFPPEPGDPLRGGALGGRWSVSFESDPTPAVGAFDVAADGRATGTFLTAAGDLRYLAGRQDGDRLRLSCFDGAHAFLFDARRGADGTLAGDFWSGPSWHETWTAERDPEAATPDPFAVASWDAGADLSALRFPDLEGTLRSLDDPMFAGRARIVQVFGSWCPNCHDASDELVRLLDRYGPRGLSIVGLAFEVTGDRERDATQVRTYARRHGVTWPLLLAGRADKTAATRALGVLDRVRSFPTTIFLHGDGRVAAVHSGFAGPATGEAHLAQRAEFERLVEELLAEPPPGQAPGQAPAEGAGDAAGEGDGAAAGAHGGAGDGASGRGGDGGVETLPGHGAGDGSPR